MKEENKSAVMHWVKPIRSIKLEISSMDIWYLERNRNTQNEREMREERKIDVAMVGGDNESQPKSNRACRVILRTTSYVKSIVMRWNDA
jgi:hypothetical protein